MRQPRLKIEEGAPVAFYHCVSRVVDRNFVLGDLEKEHFVKLMRGYETYCGVRVLTFCIMTNHFHVLVQVPKRPLPELLPSDSDLVELVKIAGCSYGATTLERRLVQLRRDCRHEEAEALREHFFANMWDVSYFMRVLKQRFSQWFNAGHARKGTLWEERFRSVLVESGDALRTVAWYIDLNPIRAGIVSEPEAYRWCGYSEAAAGVSRARQGLELLMQGFFGCIKNTKQLLAAYRIQLYVAGEENPSDEQSEGRRRGFGTAQIRAVEAAGGDLELRKALGCKVRHFTEGMILGSAAFVARHFKQRREEGRAAQRMVPREIHSLFGRGLFTCGASS